MIDYVAPDAGLLRRIAAMAFVHDDDVEGVNRDVEFRGVLFVIGIAKTLGEHPLAPEKIDSHPLNSGDVDKGVSGARIGQIFGRENLRIERLIIAEIFAPEALAIDFVFL